ncbi:MAG: VOC family protein [Euryarchaeota archaeon]|nr:VOC family protein [Euryarchaeota archaeon]
MARRSKTAGKTGKKATAKKTGARKTTPRSSSKTVTASRRPARQTGPIGDLSGIILWVSDVEESRRFFGEKLGMKVVFSEPKMDWYEYGVTESDASIAPAEPDSAWGDLESLRRRIGTPTGIIFRTNNMAKSFETLSARGVKFSKEPTATAWGGAEAEFVDPDGNSFGLIQMSKN